MPESRKRLPGTRRTFLKILGLGSGALALGYAAWRFGISTFRRRKNPPNVLFIAVDDLNSWVGTLGGHPQARTPNLDRLAARGVLFTNAHTASPRCNPSRTAVLTGIRPSTSGVYNNDQPWRAVLPDAVTLPGHFKAHGYRVLGSGKIFHGPFKDPSSWHEYHKKPRPYQPDHLPLNEIAGSEQFDWGPIDLDDDETSDAKVVAWAAERLRGMRDRSLFLACGIYRPHLPWYVPRKYFDMYPLEEVQLPPVREDDLEDIPSRGSRIARTNTHRTLVELGKWREAVQGYLASLSFSDAMVGRLLDALDASGYATETIVVLWTDHGWHLGEKLHWRKAGLWEEATHVPLIFVVPGLTSPGGRCEASVSLLDLYPTLIDICGLPPVAGLEGESLRPLLDNPRARWDGASVTTLDRNNHAIRTRRWRYIRYDDGSEELYDHQVDPHEWDNLAGKPEHAQVKKTLADRLPKINAPEAPVEIE